MDVRLAASRIFGWRCAQHPYPDFRHWGGQGNL